MRRKRAEYYRGYRFERQVRDLLRGQGFTVVRGAASKPVDLVAFRDGYAVVVECKASPKGYSVEKMKGEAMDLYNSYKVPTVLAVRDDLGIAWAVALPVRGSYAKLLTALVRAMGNRFIKVEVQPSSESSLESSRIL